METEMERYSIIDNKNKREIVLLRGNGCKWRRCRFCDYHVDYCSDDEKNFIFNKEILKNIKGTYGCLEVINSGSFTDLDEKTMLQVKKTCLSKNIKRLHFECHWIHKDSINELKRYFLKNGIEVKIKSGIETFDYLFRESYLEKGIECTSPEEMSQYFDEVCLLFGLPGQTKKSMIEDIEIGLQYFERICINIMQKNSKHILPDESVIKIFAEQIYNKYIDNERVDILMNNTDFGVGGIKDE